MKRVLVLCVLVALLAPALAQATHYVSSGQYKFNVRVTNRHYKDIRDARVTVYVSGNRATLEARAAGYRDGRTYVYLREGTTYYNASIRLDDANVSFRVKDAIGQYISGAYVDDNQFGAWGDEFEFKVRVPKEGFTKFDRNDVDLRVNHGWAWLPKIWVRDGGSYKYVEVTLKRRDLDNMFNWIDVAIPSDAQLDKHRREMGRKIRFVLQNDKLPKEQRKALQKRIAK